jgi:hypothetical protein
LPCQRCELDEIGLGVRTVQIRSGVDRDESL